MLRTILAWTVGLAAASGVAAESAKITYAEHVRPIFRESCFSCHNQNKARNDLALDSYEAVMKGGASGAAVTPGDVEDSYLYKLVTHEDEPAMPPATEKLAAAKLEIVRQWIAGGALRDAGSKAASVQPKPAMTMASGSARPAGPPIMPEGIGARPLVETARPGAVTGLAAAPWAPLLAVAGQRQVALYHMETAALLGVLPYPEGIAHAVSFSGSGAVLLVAGGHAGRHGNAVAFDVKSGKRLIEVGDEIDAVLAADINDDHSAIALGGPQRLLRVYKTADGSLTQQLKKHTDWLLAAGYSPDGVLLASADRAGGLLVWEAEGLNEYQNLEGHAGAVNDVAWRTDGNVLASAGEDGTLRLWEMNDGKQLRSIKAHDGGALAVRFARDGRLASAGRDRLVKLWAADGKPLRRFGPLADIALKVAVSHDGRRIIGGDWTGQVVVWDAESGKELARLSTQPK